MDVLTLVLLLVAALAAGWVDAVVGGGGLIQLPALLLAPGLTPIQALATNKVFEPDGHGRGDRDLLAPR